MSMNDINYIKFLLIGDEFDVSLMLRDKSKEVGMDTIYTVQCDYIARAFNSYDFLAENDKHMSMYDSLVEFLTKYDDLIKNYINNEEICLIDLVRSDFDEQN